ncbi:putative vacuolar membrane transporter for cationic amino acids [Coemansia sp. RSA 2618]|nr:putative vacuolar membrane transporter for cationic amino acids [Coemansia sp. RSA 2618]
MVDASVISGFFGYVSLACWIFVLVPQIRLNYTRKSCEGVSLAFYALWSLGDLFNLLGAVLDNLLFTAILLPIYYILTDSIVLTQFYTYRRRCPTDEECTECQPLLSSADEKPTRWPRRIAVAGGVVLVLLCVVPVLGLEPEWVVQMGVRRFFAQLCGYLSAAVYLGAYIPQIVQNYKSQSTEGLSVVMFIVVAIANVTYCLSILTAQPPTYEYLSKYASWLLGASGTIWLELIILYQFYLYRGNTH